tara:strand:- start:8 stop:238 length:231 start_codon:yes stop_codon:yes gene_type:complete
MGLLKKFAKSMLENLADDKDDNKGKGGQGLSRDEAVKKVQNDPFLKAEEERIQKDLEALKKRTDALNDKLDDLDRI